MTQPSPSLGQSLVDSPVEGLGQLPITHMVVGDPRALVLGRPVRPKVASAPRLQRWSARNWMAARAPCLSWARVGSRRRQAQARGRRAAARPESALWQHWRLFATAGVTALFAAVPLALMTLQAPSVSAPAFPVRPPTAATTSVHVLPVAYVAAPVPPAVAAAQEPPLVQAAQPVASVPPLPFSPAHIAPAPAHIAPATVPMAKRAAPHSAPPPSPSPLARGKDAAPVLVREQMPAQKQAARVEERSRPAVVLDEADPRAGSTAAVDVPAPLPPVLAVKQLASASAVPLAASKPSSDHGSGLIAITPDSKLAVFTNPRTGLPQQFRIGDPLPGGDTIRSIDGHGGTVSTSTREYSLD